MSNAVIGLFFAVGFGGWVYQHMQRTTGGNTSNSLVIAGGSALISFLLLTLLLETFIPE